MGIEIETSSIFIKLALEKVQGKEYALEKASSTCIRLNFF